jgi:hypothetical protein
MTGRQKQSWQKHTAWELKKNRKEMIETFKLVVQKSVTATEENAELKNCYGAEGDGIATLETQFCCTGRCCFC